MATYVVSDIHGYYYRFMDLLKKVEYDPNKDSLYVLGDIVDRGPHSSLMCK
jgi:predicted phosphodiesterase